MSANSGEEGPGAGLAPVSVFVRSVKQKLLEKVQVTVFFHT